MPRGRKKRTTKKQAQKKKIAIMERLRKKQASKQAAKNRDTVVESVYQTMAPNLNQTEKAMRVVNGTMDQVLSMIAEELRRQETAIEKEILSDNHPTLTVTSPRFHELFEKAKKNDKIYQETLNNYQATEKSANLTDSMKEAVARSTNGPMTFNKSMSTVAEVYGKNGTLNSLLNHLDSTLKSLNLDDLTPSSNSEPDSDDHTRGGTKETTSSNGKKQEGALSQSLGKLLSCHSNSDKKEPDAEQVESRKQAAKQFAPAP